MVQIPERDWRALAGQGTKKETKEVRLLKIAVSGFIINSSKLSDRIVSETDLDDIVAVASRKEFL